MCNLFYIGVKIAALLRTQWHLPLAAQCSAQPDTGANIDQRGRRGPGQLPIKMFNRIDWEEVLSINNYFTLLVEDPWHEAGPGPGDAADCNQDFFLVTTFMFPAFLWLVSPPPSGSTRSTANIGSVLGKGNFLTIKTCSRRWTWRASLEPHHHHVVK